MLVLEAKVFSYGITILIGSWQCHRRKFLISVFTALTNFMGLEFCYQNLDKYCIWNEKVISNSQIKCLLSQQLYLACSKKTVDLEQIILYNVIQTSYRILTNKLPVNETMFTQTFSTSGQFWLFTLERVE